MRTHHDRRDVRGHAGPAGRDAVLLAGARPAHLRPSGRMGVAALGGIERIEAVAERARRVVGDERVLPTPTRTVHRVVRVDIDQTTEAVSRRAIARRVEPEDRMAEVGVAAEQALEPAVVGPIRALLSPSDAPGPMPALQPLLCEYRRPR